METENTGRTSACPRPDLALIDVSGTDAGAFLHAQTTQAVTDIEPLACRPAAWLNPKGRVVALFDLVAVESGFRLILPADNAAPLCQGLGRYILRADVALAIVPSPRLQSVCGDIDGWLGAAGLSLPAGRAVRAGGALAVRTRPHHVVLIGESDVPSADLAEPEPMPLDGAWLESIRAGWPAVTSALSARYLPQMLNLDRLDAVSFTKGCYPGQEIVARTTNLGQVKRRLQRFALAAGDPPAPGAQILAADGTSAGEVNRAAAAADGVELLAVTQLGAPEPLRLALDERTLAPLALPYAI